MLMVTLVCGFLAEYSLAQKPYRVGTTTANFLEIGIGSAGNAMGEAYVSMANDLSSIYWNPAGLAFMRQNEAQFMYQPWFVDISTQFVGAAVVVPRVGTIAASVFYMDYGEMDVTTLEYQDGTGETFTASDFNVSLAYSRKLADWFAFGATGKFISSQIWHLSASAMAMDLGVIINTHFLSPTGARGEGMRIGMSISNYGSRMQYDGIDLITPIDIRPDENGNYADVPGQYRLQGWELPLIFRLGTSYDLIRTSNNRVSLSVDALHPNNNSESINVGAQYELNIPATGRFYIRGGYKSLFMVDSNYGMTFGAGMELDFMGNTGLKLDYAYKAMNLFNAPQSFTVGVVF
ncbi:MAG: PorV/PorQ family protein [Candidatus Marinimicrobia bacterium]|nr:PorV/PorQ family protein [Candidatus Neomarinimicrobiota bacterium]MCF7829556.1 PorV/PorQ family protein [Candidatus Neomarinimicrobiota bacterium]MCF7882006.1 PorV/PorQ family protein [Candidatus Neomarinimicrobiota bacterium]